MPHLLGHESPQAEESRADHYRELVGEAKLFPGARDLLRRVHDEGLVVVLASSAPRDELQIMIDLLDVGDAIDATTSSSDVTESKPAPDVFEAAMTTGQVDPRRCLVIGDSTWDVRAARAASLACIAVETGGFSSHELREEGARQVYRDVDEIVAQYLTSPLAHLRP